MNHEVREEHEGAAEEFAFSDWKLCKKFTALAGKLPDRNRRQIREQKAHYVLALTGNQESLAADMQSLFERGIETDFAGMKHAVHHTVETGHGLAEEQTCHVLELPKDQVQCAAPINTQP